MEKKICPKCGDEKKFPDDFNSQGIYCKSCHRANSKSWRVNNREKQREMKRRNKAAKPELYCEIQRRGSAKHYQKNREAYIAKAKESDRRLKRWFRDLKKTLKCKHCGLADFRCLDFHHLRDKKFTVCDMVRNGFAKAKILKEIAKCIVLCRNCHAIEHYSETQV